MKIMTTKEDEDEEDNRISRQGFPCYVVVIFTILLKQCTFITRKKKLVIFIYFEITSDSNHQSSFHNNLQLPAKLHSGYAYRKHKKGEK